jgi:methyl-accepting chemotaxis protein
LELNAFSERNVSAITLGETGNVAIIDKKGITLAHQKKDYILKVDLSKMDFGKQVLAQKTGLVRYDWEARRSWRYSKSRP